MPEQVGSVAPRADSGTEPDAALRLRATIDHAPVGIAHFDTAGTFLLVNDRLCEILGYARAHLLARTFQEITFPDDLPGCLELTRRLARGEIPRYQIEKRFVRPDGGHVWARVTVAAVRGDDGEPAFFIGIAEDITEQVALVERQRLAEARLNQALDASLVGAFQFDVRRNALEWSHGLPRLFGGAERSTLDGFFELIHPEDGARVMEAYERSAKEGAEFEIDFRVVWPDGSIHWLHDRGQVVPGADGQPHYIVGAVIDITNHKRLEEVIRGQDARFQALANAIPQLAWIADSRAHRSWFNERWLEYTGTTMEEVQGLGWMKVHRADRAQLVLEEQLRCFRDERPWEATVLMRGRSGEYRWFLSRAMPVRDDAGRVRLWVGTNTDVTEHKRAEEEREALLASERTARAAAEEASRRREQTLAFVAHDLRNPVQTVVMAAGALTDLPLPPEKRAQQLEIIKRSAWRMNRLIGDLLDVSLMEAGTFGVNREPLELDRLLDEVIESFAAQARARSLSLETDIGDGLPRLHGDRDRLQQVLTNLVGNAIKFTPAGGRVVVGARPCAGEVEVYVRDTGCGIAADHLEKVFERFWQVRRDRGGAGLGLMIARGIVEAHGGRITVESVVGAGSTFRVALPATGGGPHDDAPVESASSTAT
jgi:PAS domain S-box-containing protein